MDANLRVLVGNERRSVKEAKWIGIDVCVKVWCTHAHIDVWVLIQIHWFWNLSTAHFSTLGCFVVHLSLDVCCLFTPSLLSYQISLYDPRIISILTFCTHKFVLVSDKPSSPKPGHKSKTRSVLLHDHYCDSILHFSPSLDELDERRFAFSNT